MLIILIFLFVLGKVHFDVTIMPESGYFEILEGGSVTATGRVVSLENADTEAYIGTEERADFKFDLTTSDIYKELRLRGYDYGPTFQGIVGSKMSGNRHLFFYKIT